MFIRSIISILLSFMIITSVNAFDQTGKNAAGLTVGKVIPVGNNAFNNEADGFWAYGGYIRHHFNPNWVTDLAFTRMDYDKICTCTRSNVLDLLGTYRFNGAEDVTPVVGLGLGVVENHSHENLHLGIRARVGVEKAFSEKLALGVHLDYQSISKLPGASMGPIPSNMNLLVPKIELTWYFENK